MASPPSVRNDRSASTSSAGSDVYANASVFKHSPYYKNDQLDDLSHGSTAKARRWSGGKKNLGEGRSHFESRALDSDQRNPDKKEKLISVKKNKELSTRMKKNHNPDQAAKVFDADRRQST
ncbi:hypothetical protein BCV70DRAFT_120730 [Testicularia cyperi]|uniref:Uncharacterized protein n=1 Tax=Testicularia cyperi TaxID=1882483 RepID=A0A317XKV4_9BASI|nr:hypothetical protein BCV70DRAFT_120730 [Testicularia cyperi]